MRILFGTQRLDRIELGGAPRRFDPEEETDSHREPDREYHRLRAYRGARVVGLVSDHRDQYADQESNQAAAGAQRQRLDQKLGQNITLAGADRLAQADLASALTY